MGLAWFSPVSVRGCSLAARRRAVPAPQESLLGRSFRKEWAKPEKHGERGRGGQMAEEGLQLWGPHVLQLQSRFGGKA